MEPTPQEPQTQQEQHEHQEQPMPQKPPEQQEVREQIVGYLSVGVIGVNRTGFQPQEQVSSQCE